MRHVYEPRAALVEGGKQWLIKLLPSFPAQPGCRVSCSHRLCPSLCPSRDITDTVILTPSAGSLLLLHTWMAVPATPWPLAQLAEEMIHMMTPRPVLNGCSSSTSPVLLAGAPHATCSASSLPGRTLIPFCIRLTYQNINPLHSSPKDKHFNLSLPLLFLQLPTRHTHLVTSKAEAVGLPDRVELT